MGLDSALAVVGMACRLPGARNLDALWQNVLHDVCSIQPLPAERFNRERYFDPEVGAYAKSYSAIGGLVDDAPFDPAAFGLSNDEARTLDTAHRWALGVAGETLADAGVDPGELRGRNVGVVIGHARGSMLTSDLAFATAVEGLIPRIGALPGLSAGERTRAFEAALSAIRARYPSHGGQDLGRTLASGLAGRIAQAFGFTGRHLVVDAACASSFAALDLAGRALQAGRIDAAITGGASYSQELSVVLFAQSRALSGDGSFPFDERANGFVSSDGFGFFLLMRLEDALRQGRRVRAVLRGIGGACDGKGKALWAPRKEGQVLAMRRAYAQAGLEPGTIGLLEAHATSTPIGDATEIQALQEVFGPASKGRPLPIGSIKGNIGHTREAAGAAGLIKSILAIEHGVLPPTGGLRTPSTQIPWREVVAEPIQTARPWPLGGVRRAGVSAFGIGGLDYHVLVEEPPARSPLASSLGVELAAGPTTNPAPRGPLELAIVGWGARLPGALGAEAFRARLASGEEAISDVPDARWPAGVFVSAERSAYRTPTGRGGFVTGFSPDWRRYKVPPKLVEQNDPLQFMLLEAASDALASAGVELAAIDRTRVGVLMGTTFGSDYALELSLAIRAPELGEELARAAGRPGERALIDATTAGIRAQLPTIDEDSSGSFSSSTLASRVAKTLDLMGPTYTLDAACDASLATIEAAAELLSTGGADLVLAGGGDRAMRAQRFATFAQAGLLSPSGRPRPFSPEADGLLPAEGAAVFVLERLEDARRHGRPVLAVLRAIGSASETRPMKLDAPSTDAVRLAARRALAQAGARPEDVGLVEAHGLGVPAWDEAERATLGDVYLERGTPIVLASSKQLTGHAAGAAGSIALATALTALHTGRVAGARVTAEGAPAQETLPEGLVAVSSMSFGGSSHHVLLQGPEPTQRARNDLEGTLIELAGDTWDDVRRLASSGALGPEEVVRIGPFSRVRRAGSGPLRVHFGADGPAAIAERLELVARTSDPAPARGLLAKQGVFVRDARTALGRVAFLFSGQGSQYGGMFRGLIADVPTAQALVTRSADWLAARGRGALRDVLGGERIPDDVFWVQASLLVADLVALAAAESVGLTADVVTGHSYGDYPALVASGAWSLETALAATELRARGIEAAVEPGGMISASTDAAGVAAIVDTVRRERPELGVLVASNLNSPRQTVVSGTLAALEVATRSFERVGIEVRRVDAPRAFHSPLMAAARAPLQEGLASLLLTPPRGIFVSSVTGGPLSEPDQIRASLVEQLTRPVDFVAQIEGLVAAGVRTFVECGPKGILTSLTQDIVARLGVAGGVEIVPADDPTRGATFQRLRLGALVASRLRAAENAVAETVVAETRAAETSPAGRPTDPVPEAARPTVERPTWAPPARPEALPEPEPIDDLVVLHAPELSSRPGFADFWTRTQPAMASMVRALWEEEARARAEAEARLAAEIAAREAAEAALASRRPGRTRRPAVALAATVESAAPAIAPPQEIQQFLVEALAAHTGYPLELIDPRADLEADLGVDTVKQAQVLGKARDRYQLRADRALSLADFNTVEKIVAYVSRELAQRSSEPVRPRIPVVDLTLRRSQRPAQEARREDVTAQDARPTLRPPSDTPTAAVPGGRTSGRPTHDPVTRREDDPTQDTRVTLRPGTETNARAELPARAPMSETPTARGEAVTPPVTVRLEPAMAAAVVRSEAVTPRPAPVPAVLGPPSLRAPSIPLTVLELRGTPRELGRQHGEALRDPIRDTMDRYESFLGDHGLRSLDVPEATRLLPALFDEDALDELRGLAEAARLPFEHLLAYNLDAALFPAFTPGCTQVVRTARANGGRLLHAINEDSPLLVHLGSSEARVVQLRRRTDLPGEPVAALFSLVGQISGPNAANDRGLTITSTTLLDGRIPRGLPEGSPHPLLVKRLAERASTLDEVDAIVESALRTGRWSLLVSSVAADRALYLEYDGDRILERRLVDDTLVSTNHALNGPSEGCVVPDHSRLRLQRAEQLFGDGALPREAFERGLRDQVDLGRGRAVRHPTMNTVRRVDNVMSLISDPRAGELRVSARVDPPGTPIDVPMEFLTLRLDRPGSDEPRGRGPDEPRGRGPDEPPRSEGLRPVPERMRRAVVRVNEAPQPPQRQSLAGQRLLLAGSGARADAIAGALAARGVDVHRAPTFADAAARDPADFELLGLVTPGPLSGDAEARRTEVIETAFTLLQRFAGILAPGGASVATQPRPATPSPAHAEAHPRGVFAVVELGGGLGFANLAEGAPDDGGLVGLLKALRREQDGLLVLALDAAPSEPPSSVAAALIAELEAGAPRLEVGRLRGRRLVVTLPDRPLEVHAAGPTRLPRSWLLTGGARGVTAAIAKRLAETAPARLHLVGRAPLPSPELLARGQGLEGRALADHLLEQHKRTEGAAPSVLELRAQVEALERAREIDATITHLRRLGSTVYYHAADLADPAQARRVVDEAAAYGPIEGLVHGAGVEVARAFARKSPDAVRATIGAKLDAFLNLRPLLRDPALTHVVAFSSVSGRFGGHGQTDYALANEALARHVGRLRLDRPELHATAIAWPAWDEVGMASRGSARTFLEQTGQAFMSPDEGANHFLRELWAGLPEPEVVIHGELSALDLDRTLVPAADADRFAERATEVRATPLLGALVTHDEALGTLVTERILSVREPFLDQHRMGAAPILPAVVALEGLLELVGMDSDRFTVGELEILQPLKLVDGRPVTATWSRHGEALALSARVERADGVVLDPARVFVRAERRPRRPLERRPVAPWTGDGVPYPYSASFDPTPGARTIFHGPAFRTLQAALPLGHGHGRARLTVPPAEALVPGSSRARWRVPAALLDGCLQAVGLLARLELGLFGLPHGLGRIDASPGLTAMEGVQVELSIALREEGELIVADLHLSHDGEPLMSIERYTAQILRSS